MSLHFLLDGYNIIKQTPSLNQGTLEDQRLALISWINRHQPHGSVKNSTTVVFDGSPDIIGSLRDIYVKVIFSQYKSADELIKSLVQQYPKKQWVVVSNDKDIKLYVRTLGAMVLTVKEYLGKSQEAKAKKSGTSRNAEQTSSKYITLTQQAKINQELERLWLKQQ